MTGAKLPVTLGHEFSGTIEAVGAGVSQVKVGDRVAIKPNLYDGSCASCQVGRVNSCRNLGFIGYSSKYGICCLFSFWEISLMISTGNVGGLSDHVVVKEKHAIGLPDSIPLDVAGTNRTFPTSLHTCPANKFQP